MPRRCCVPGCKANYDSLLKENQVGTSTFSFPKDDNLKCEWLRAIPRKDWTPTKSSAVCANHFHKSDIIRYDKWLQPDGSFKTVQLKHPKLKASAVPAVFPNVPKYLSKPPQQERRSPDTRRKRIIEVHNEKVEEFLRSDLIVDFNDLVSNYSKKVNLFN